MTLPALRDLIDRHFTDAELRLLCYDLAIEYENLPGEIRVAKAQSLVEYCRRHNQLPDLDARLRELHPAVAWPDVGVLAVELAEIQQTAVALTNTVKDETLRAAVLAPLQQREAELQNQLTIIIGTDSQIPSKHFPPHWESHYLQTVIAQCDRLDTTPLSAGETATDAPSISAVFTTLYLQNVSRAEDETIAEALSPRRNQEKLLEKQREQERHPITASEAIAALPRLVILGQPGGGKSTLVNYLAAQLAQQRLGTNDTSLPDWPAEKTPIPVRIVLRRFAEWLAAEKRSGTAGDVWDYLFYMLERWGCADSCDGLRHTLIESGGIVFFDGLDEIRDPAARQKIIKGAVVDFAAAEKQCQVMVTSRPYAYTEEAQWRLPAAQFPVVSLAPFADEQITAFNRAWYVRVMGPRRGWDDDQCRQRAEILTNTLLNLPHLRRLAASPLLLTLIAQVHGEGGTLPDNRADLYRRAVELLLMRWENRIVLDTRPGEEVTAEEVLWLGVPAAHLQNVLAQIAYNAHKQQGELAAGGAQAEQAAAEQVAEISHTELKLALVARFDSGAKADQILNYIQHRAGLLLAQDEAVYTFPHRTFQEYLAAHYLLNQSDGLEQLCAKVKAQPDWWREVFLLSAGSSVTVPKNVQDLINTLLPFDAGAADMPLTTDVPTWVSIAAQALVETNFEYHVRQESTPGGFTAVYRRVQHWLQRIMTADTLLPAATRAEAGQWLARLSDNRPGVGIDPQTGLPNIIWSAEIPAGTYTIGDDKSDYDDEKPRQVIIKRPFRLARYPITNVQYQSFIDAADRDDREWWVDIPADEQKFSEPGFPYANHPRETVSWYQALAFCRWLNDKLRRGLLQNKALAGGDYELRLPHEYEWEVAARWPNQTVEERIYPWGTEFDAAKANTYEGDRIGQTTSVGIYPAGKNVALELYDLSGNVWEWCLNKYSQPEETAVDNSSRVLRGGAWYSSQFNARAAYRFGYDPDNRNNYLGFRVVVVRRSPSH